MKILFWTEQFWPFIGGMEVFVPMLINAFVKRGHQVRVIAMDHGKETYYKKVPIYRFNIREMLENKDIKQLGHAIRTVNQLLEEFQPNIIHLNIGLRPDHFLYLKSRAVNIPCLLTIHGHHQISYLSKGKSFYDQLFNKVDKITVVSRKYNGCLQQIFPYISPIIINNALPLPKLSPTQLILHPPKLLYVGRLVKEKGVDLAISALQEILKIFPQTELWIAGDGLEKNNLKLLVNKLNIIKQVKFLNWVEPEQIPSLINQVSLVLMPSRHVEPFPLVALQACQMARPIIATNSGGLSEIIIHDKTGILVPQEDIKALAKAVIQLLKQPNKLQKMGNAARERVLKKFNVDKMIDSYEQLYHRTIECALNKGKLVK